MIDRVLPSVAVMLWAAHLMAAPARAQPTTPAGIATACHDAADRAERQHGLPPGLLLAIGRQESGRWDAEVGETLPWPFSVNAAGESRFFETRDEAVGFVARSQAAGVESIDVGCFQINLLHHPQAFANLNEAFDPDANAHYAARFLVRLHAETGNWEAAVGRYHSATAGIGDTYKSAVLRLWSSDGAAREKVSVLTSVGPWRQIVAGITVQRPGAPTQPAAAQLAPHLPRVITPLRS